MSSKIKDGEGALYFVKPQAEKKTPQQLREDSRGGLVSMPSYLGKSRFVSFICKVLRRA